MSYLIDTQIFLWWLSDDRRLSEKTRSLITSPENEFYLSAASIWEISIKSSIGKLPKIKNVSALAEEEGFVLLSILPLHAELVNTFAAHHKDPFDRLLIAQAKSLKLRFLTADRLLKSYGSFVVVA
jgi:PIN domain nuclease of toxin-antitoxin system